MLCICLCGHTLKAPRDTGQSVDTQTSLLWNTVQNKMKRIGSFGKKRLHWVKDQQQVLSIYALNRKDCWCQFSLKITAGNKLVKESTEEFFFFFKCKTIKESLVKKNKLKHRDRNRQNLQVCSFPSTSKLRGHTTRGSVNKVCKGHFIVKIRPTDRKMQLHTAEILGDDLTGTEKIRQEGRLAGSRTGRHYPAPWRRSWEVSR